MSARRDDPELDGIIEQCAWCGCDLAYDDEGLGGYHELIEGFWLPFCDVVCFANYVEALD